MAVAFGSLHALAFLLMADSRVEFVALVVPFLYGGLPVAFGIVALELMVTIALSTAVARALRYRRWLWLHRLGYLAIGLGVVHSLLGAMIDRHFAALWLAGLAVLVPTALIAALRFVPARFLTRIGVLKSDVAKPQLRVTVNNHRCHRYGICEAEAPGNFKITEDGRLRYERRPAPSERVPVRMAARACPMQAITLEERGQ
jgi:sulfoxide reductase heme-binding subunit YedZ